VSDLAMAACATAPGLSWQALRGPLRETLPAASQLTLWLDDDHSSRKAAGLSHLDHQLPRIQHSQPARPKVPKVPELASQGGYVHKLQNL